MRGYRREAVVVGKKKYEQAKKLKPSGDENRLLKQLVTDEALS